jgi:hypothetical protein
LPELERLARERGGTVLRLAAGGVVIRFDRTDRRTAARRAAELALLLEAALPGKTLALAAGEEEDAADAAATLAATIPLEATLGAETGVWLDAAAAALPQDDFTLVHEGTRFRLVGPR